MTAPEPVTLHHPVIAGVHVTVGAERADQWREQGWCDPDQAPAEDAVPAGAPDATWTIAQLRAHAEQHGVDVAAAKKKDEILAALAAAPTPVQPAE